MNMPPQNSYELAHQFIESGDFGQAAQQLEEFLRNAPNDAAAHNDLGVLQFRSGDHTAALAHMLQALRLDPTNLSFAENIIDVCHSLGMHQQAAEMEQLVFRQRENSKGNADRTPAGGTAPRVIGDIDLDALVGLPVTDRNALLTWYWALHPRFRFFKSVRPGGNVIDIGAGGGGLVTWKTWLEPHRTDLHLYAVDLQKAELFDKYAGYQICNLDKEELKFEPSFFDAAVLSHVLEHIEEPKNLLCELRRVMRVGGEVYIEVPTLESMDFPSRLEFLAAGVPVSTVNFFDDSTHRRTFGLNELKSLVEASGFRIAQAGAIRNRFTEDTMIMQGAAHNDEELCTYGVWSRLGFAHYIVALAV